MSKKVTIGSALALPLAFGLAVTLAGCQENLGDPVIRYADWDAQAPGTDAQSSGTDGGGSSNTNNALAYWQPECGINGYYACPPYGLKRGDVIQNKIFASGNLEADLWANVDGVFSLADYYQSDAKLLFVYYAQNG